MQPTISNDGAIIPPAPARPQSDEISKPPDVAAAVDDVIDLAVPGAVARGSTPASIIDTTRFEQQIELAHPVPGVVRRVRDHVPPHDKLGPIPVGPPNDLTVGGILDFERTIARDLFPGIGATGWVPPDCTIAVGPTHVIATVNQSIAFYDRSGSIEFAAILGVDGNPGFFEDVGAGNFPFDPKCFYDHYDHRFVVVAPEVYGSTEAWITIAVSDDANPHGVWYKYRTNAVISVGSQTFWWDYPGFGYDHQGYYVTSNLFGLNQGGWGGVGFRVFDKAPMLRGQPAVYSTLRDGGAASVQVAQHFGFNQAPFFVSAASTSSIRIHSITNPLTAPALVSTGVGVPFYAGPFGAPTPGGNTLDVIDSRIMNVQWRDRQLYAAHHISSGGRNMARWYHFDTVLWPATGGIALIESGNVDAGAGLHSFFPAIYSNRLNQVGLVCGSSSASQRVNILTTGREPTDPAGTMGTPTQQQLSNADVGGRWGDYFGMAVDPLDDTRFWAVGEYQIGGGWSTWITSFTVGNPAAPFAILDNAGTVLAAQPKRIDVLANDYHSGTGEQIAIQTWDSTSRFGGVIALSPGTGPAGRDELLYTPPNGYLGQDTFSYVIQDTSGDLAFGSVIVNIVDPSQFRAPDLAGSTAPGAAAAYFTLSNPSVLPDFSTLTPFGAGVSAQVNYPSTGGVFADSGLSDNVGAVFDGYINVPSTDFYTLYTSSDDGSRLWIGSTLVVDNDGLHGMAERAGTIGLQAGTHAIRVEFFERGGGAGLIASIAGGGMTKQPIPAALWRHPVCAGDLNADGLIDLADLTAMLANFGTASGATPAQGDMDDDGDVDLSDLTALLSIFGSPC